MRLGALFVVVASMAALATASENAGSVGTRTFELDSLEKLSGGDVKGVSVGSDGVVRAGWTLGNVPLPADAGTTATCAVALADGSVLVGPCLRRQGGAHRERPGGRARRHERERRHGASGRPRRDRVRRHDQRTHLQG